MNNEFIADRIKQARKEKGLTQAQLAEYLNRTPSNVSDIERCRVQVNAEDLFFIAQVLQKPIDFFYGIELDDEEIEKMKLAYNIQSNKGKENSNEIFNLIFSMQDFVLKSKRNDENFSDVEIAEFAKNYFLLKGIINNINNEITKAGILIMSVLEERGLSLPATSQVNYSQENLEHL